MTEVLECAGFGLAQKDGKTGHGPWMVRVKRLGSVKKRCRSWHRSHASGAVCQDEHVRRGKPVELHDVMEVLMSISPVNGGFSSSSWLQPAIDAGLGLHVAWSSTKNPRTPAAAAVDLNNRTWGLTNCKIW